MVLVSVNVREKKEERKKRKEKERPPHNTALIFPSVGGHIFTPVFHVSLLSPYRETTAHGPNFSRPSPDLLTEMNTTK